MAEQKIPNGTKVFHIVGGGPCMAVCDYGLFSDSKTEMYLCSWFNSDRKGVYARTTDLFYEAELKPASE